MPFFVQLINGTSDQLMMMNSHGESPWAWLLWASIIISGFAIIISLILFILSISRG